MINYLKNIRKNPFNEVRNRKRKYKKNEKKEKVGYKNNR